MKICSENNENSVKYYESFQTKNEIAIVLELCDDCLSKFKNKKSFNEKKIREILKQLNNTLKIMKEKKIVHRDLKPDNILIKTEKDKQIIKLCDYGISKIGNMTRLKTHIGTLHYMAPEILEGQTYYTYKCDLWSLGIVIYELFFKERPYMGQNEIALLANIKLKKNNKLKDTGDASLNDLIKQLLEYDPEKRMTWDDYFNHPFFNNNINIKKFDSIGDNSKNILDNNNQITIKYKKPSNKNKIRIFGKEFVGNNKNKCKIKYNDDGYHTLREYIEIKNDKGDIIEIKLNGINDITDLSNMFADCDMLISLSDISKWNVEKVTDMSYMFYNCESLESLPDISKWNVDKVTNLSHMFSNCESLKNLPDIYFWNTIKVTNMSDIFSNCKLLKYLPDISNWDISNVTNLSYMLFNCESLESLPDISNWKTSKVSNMSYMFFKCKSLKSLPDISKWPINSIKNMNGMFFGCNFPLTNLSKFLD